MKNALLHHQLQSKSARQKQLLQQSLPSTAKASCYSIMLFAIVLKHTLPFYGATAVGASTGLRGRQLAFFFAGGALAKCQNATAIGVRHPAGPQTFHRDRFSLTMVNLKRSCSSVRPCLKLLTCSQTHQVQRGRRKMNSRKKLGEAFYIRSGIRLVGWLRKSCWQTISHL